MERKVVCLLFMLMTIKTFGQQDKVKHFVAGSTISFVSYKFLYKKTKNHPKSLLLGMASGIVAGIAKEVYDPVFDNNDLLATSFGSISIGITINLQNQRKKHPRNERTLIRDNNY
jgi:hypothetical protein